MFNVEPAMVKQDAPATATDVSGIKMYSDGAPPQGLSDGSTLISVDAPGSGSLIHDGSIVPYPMAIGSPEEFSVGKGTTSRNR